MALTMKRKVEIIFDRLVSYCNSNTDLLPFDYLVIKPKSTHIKEHGNFETNTQAFSNYKILRSICERDFHAVGFLLNNCQYFYLKSTIGLSNFNAPGIIDLNILKDQPEYKYGFSLALIYENIVSIKHSDSRPLEVYNNLLDSEGPHNIETLLEIYDFGNMWQLTDGVDVKSPDSLYKFYCLYMLSASEQSDIPVFALDFQEDLLLEIFRLLIGKHGNLYSYSVYRALTSTNWQHFYLEMFQILEKLFPLPKARLVYEKHSIEYPKLLDSWEIINYWIQPLTGTPGLVELAYPYDPDIEKIINSIGIRKEKYADVLINMRNSIAHSNLSHSKPATSNADMALLVLGLSKILNVLYNQEFDDVLQAITSASSLEDN